MTVSAITGVLAARGKQVDLFGVIVLAVVTALGGGTLRDMILGGGAVFWIHDPRYLVNAALTALVTFYLVRYHDLPRFVLLIADAFALAFFTILGARKGLALSNSATVAVAMGVITGVAGGIIRDLLIGEIPLVFRREIYLYATAAFCGTLGYLALNWYSADTSTNTILGTLITLVLRLAGIRWKIALPVFRPKSLSDS